MTNDRRSWLIRAPLVLLCLLVGSRWLLEQGPSGASSTLYSQAMGCLLAGCCFGGLAAKRRSSTAPAGFRRSVPALGLALALTGPALAAAISGRRISSGNSVLAMALTPVVVATLHSLLDQDGRADLIGSLWPGLAGLAGLLLLLPEPALSGWRSWCGLLCMPLLTGIGASLASAGDSGRGAVEAGSRRWRLTLGSGLSGGVFLLLAALNAVPPQLSTAACGLDGATFFLSGWTLVTLGPSRWSAQFLLIPLLGLVESIAVLHPTLDARSWIGLACLAVSGLRLLFSEEQQSDPGTTLDLH